MSATAADERIDRIVEAIQQTNVVLEGMRVSLNGLVEQQHDHEKRLRLLERWRNNLTPVLAALTFLMGVVVSELIQRVTF